MDRADELHKIMKECRAELNEITEKERKEKIKNYTNRYFTQKINPEDFNFDEKDYQEHPDRYEYRKYLGSGGDDYNYCCFRFQGIDQDGIYMIESSYNNNNDPAYFKEITAEEFCAAWRRLLQKLSEINL
jgi:hypothetical protein